MKIYTAENEKNLLAKKLKAVEEALGINAKELSRRCGISDSTIYRIEGRNKQKTGVSENLIRKICINTGADPEWMLDFDDTSLNVVWMTIPEVIRTDSAPGERVRILRKELKMRQEEFANCVGISRGHAAAIEQGRKHLTRQIADQIEKSTGKYSAEWLLTGEERNKEFPIGNEMIEWLKNHKDKREIIWTWMKEEKTC